MEKVTTDHLPGIVANVVREWYDAESDRIMVELETDGRKVAVPANDCFVWYEQGLARRR